MPKQVVRARVGYLARMQTMLAGVVAAPGVFEMAQVPVPQVAGPHDVVLDVRAAGVCGTDLHVIRDPEAVGVPLGTVLGHEFVGVVREVGDAVRHVRPGDRVVAGWGPGCGVCASCRRGLPHFCTDSAGEDQAFGFLRPGGFAPHCRIADVCAFAVPDHVEDWQAALAEPLSTVLHGVRRAAPFPGERALVIGAGPIGLLYIGVLRLAGCDVVALEPSAPRAAAAREMGALAVVEPGPDAAARVRELTGGMGPEIVIDAVGTQLPIALDVVREAGRVVLFGVAMDTSVEVKPLAIQSRDVQVLGANVGSFVFTPALRLIEQGRIDFAPVVSQGIALADLPGAIERQRRGEIAKALVTP